MACCTASASPAATTGTPVTMYFAPLSGLNVFSAVGGPDQVDRVLLLGVAQVGRSRIWTSAAFFDGNR